VIKAFIDAQLEHLAECLEAKSLGLFNQANILLKKAKDFKQKSVTLREESTVLCKVGNRNLTKIIIYLMSVLQLVQRIRIGSDDKEAASDVTDEIDTIPTDEIDTVPIEFKCPISGEVMKNPSVNVVGQTYDMASIKEWYSRGNLTDPLTGNLVKSTKIFPNLALKSQILRWHREVRYKISKTPKIDKVSKSLNYSSSIGTILRSKRRTECSKEVNIPEDVRINDKRPKSEKHPCALKNRDTISDRRNDLQLQSQFDREILAMGTSPQFSQSLVVQEKYDSETKLVAHVNGIHRRKQPSESIKCELCGVTFSDAVDYRYHKALDHFDCLNISSDDGGE